MSPRRLAFISLAAIVLGPGLAGAQGRPSGSRLPAPGASLPSVPPASGPLELRIVYPLARQIVAAVDSTFLFGSVGNGRATLAVNGLPVTVAPNGAFLAWVPLPPEPGQVFRFVARLGADSAVRDLEVQLLEREPPHADTGLWADRSSIRPRGVQWVEPGEPVRLSLTAAPGSTVTLELPGQRPIPLAPDTTRRITSGPFDRTMTRAPQTETRYVGWFPAVALGAPPATDVLAVRTAPVPWDSAQGAQIVIAVGEQTMRIPVPLRLGLLDPTRLPVVLLDDDTARAGDTDGAVSATPTPEGTFHWFFPNGSTAAVNGRRDAQVRVKLSDGVTAWVNIASIAAVLPAGTPPPRATLGLVRLYATEPSVAARLALTQRVPFRVDEDGNRLTVRLYGTRMDLDWVQYGSTDPFVDRVTWDQEARDEGVVTFELTKPVFGYRTRWEGSDLILEIRRPPVINPRHPLRGRTIAVDPGHPPAGASGPTGFQEKDANLAVARVLRRLLAAAGATVIMTRDADSAVGLYQRTNLAEQKDADILVSIHNNAFPDGVNPWVNNGTSTYYYQPRSAHLARDVQDALTRRMGLRNLGFGRGDLALVRPTWMPAVLTEGAFLMIPEQENALRTPAFQERYARGVLEGIEAFLRELAGQR
jgi:N-acetylmuramoyl-L-alanine amidase